MAIDLLKAKPGDRFEAWDGLIYEFKRRGKSKGFVMVSKRREGLFDRKGKSLDSVLFGDRDIMRQIERQSKESA